MLPPWTWVSRVVIVQRGASMSVLASSPGENPNHSDQDRRCWRKRCDLHSGVPPNKAIELTALRAAAHKPAFARPRPPQSENLIGTDRCAEGTSGQAIDGLLREA